MTRPGLGTQLRTLLELLDGELDGIYAEDGLDYRPRFTPVLRALMSESPLTVGQIAAKAGISQPAATQTLTLMLARDWVTPQADPADARRRLFAASAKAVASLPQLQAIWAATGGAARGLDDELSTPLSALLDEAIAALRERSFPQRRRDAAQAMAAPSSSSKKDKT
jgi:DNA-binding MarR family transcriptional regulator